MKLLDIVVVGALGVVLGCTAETRDDGLFGTGADGDTGAAADDSGPGDSGPDSGGPTGPDSADEGGEAGESGEIKFDTPSGAEGPGDMPGGMGCKKVDFLFVVDNSGSMAGEQQNLSTSFPGFIDEIKATVAEDYHIMVVDTDAGGGTCNISAWQNDCTNWCATQCPGNCDCSCNGSTCPSVDNGCAKTLGAGKITDQLGNSCDMSPDKRYLDDGDDNLEGTFSCIAEVGTWGDGNERPMQALVTAITSQAGQCNQGFLRSDAILVATVISDENDMGKSQGNPTTWKQTLVDAKAGDEKAIVALALVGDTDLPNAVCEPINGGDGALGAPNMRAWAESFFYGSWGAVCVPDYTQFFSDAISVIDTACEDFDPPG